MLFEDLRGRGVEQARAASIGDIDYPDGPLSNSAEGGESSLHLSLLAEQPLLRAPIRGTHGVLRRVGEEAVT